MSIKWKDLQGKPADNSQLSPYINNLNSKESSIVGNIASINGKSIYSDSDIEITGDISWNTVRGDSINNTVISEALNKKEPSNVDIKSIYNGNTHTIYGDGSIDTYYAYFKNISGNIEDNVKLNNLFNTYTDKITNIDLTAENTAINDTNTICSDTYSYTWSTESSINSYLYDDTQTKITNDFTSFNTLRNGFADIISSYNTINNNWKNTGTESININAHLNELNTKVNTTLKNNKDNCENNISKINSYKDIDNIYSNKNTSTLQIQNNYNNNIKDNYDDLNTIYTNLTNLSERIANNLISAENDEDEVNNKLNSIETEYNNIKQNYEDSENLYSSVSSIIYNNQINLNSSKNKLNSIETALPTIKTKLDNINSSKSTIENNDPKELIANIESKNTDIVTTLNNTEELLDNINISAFNNNLTDFEKYITIKDYYSIPISAEINKLGDNKTLLNRYFLSIETDQSSSEKVSTVDKWKIYVRKNGITEFKHIYYFSINENDWGNTLNTYEIYLTDAAVEPIVENEDVCVLIANNRDDESYIYISVGKASDVTSGNKAGYLKYGEIAEIHFLYSSAFNKTIISTSGI